MQVLPSLDSGNPLRNPFCRPQTDPPGRPAGPWQRRSFVQAAVAIAATLPLVAISVRMYLMRQGPITLAEMLLGPLVGGGSMILWILLLNRLAGDRAANLGVKTDRLGLELALGLGLAAVLLGLHATFGGVLMRLFPAAPPPGQIIELLDGLSRRPALLALWLGPVVWIGVAGFEELWRVHLLRRLWRIGSGPAGRHAVVVVAAAAVAAGHLYQPPAIMVSIGVLSLLQGWFFMATGRYWALVVAHALYDSAQIIAAVVAIRGAG